MTYHTYGCVHYILDDEELKMATQKIVRTYSSGIEFGLATFLWTFFIVYPVAIFCSLNSAGERYPNVE